MAILYINTGSYSNAGDGDSLRTAFNKINNNFVELTTLLGSTATEVTELVQDRVETMFVHSSHTGLTALYDDAADKIVLTVLASGTGLFKILHLLLVALLLFGTIPTVEGFMFIIIVLG